MGPAILLDKSALVGLGHGEVRTLRRYFTVIVPPITMIELLSEAGKPRSDAKYRFTDYANKLTMHYIDQEDHCVLMFLNLMGTRVEMQGRPVKPGGRRVVAEDGSVGHFWDVSEVNKKLLRWQNGQLTDSEKDELERWRKIKELPYLHDFKERLKVNIPDGSIRTPEDAHEAARRVIFRSDPESKHATVEMVICLFNVNARGRTDAYNCWLERDMPGLLDTAPYAAYSFVVFTTFYVGLMSELIPTSKKSSAYIDLQYLYYLPFCKAFFSSDSFHSKWAPILGETVDCEFVATSQLRVELARISELLEQRHKPNPKTQIDSPPQFEGSILNRIWDRVCRR